MDTKEKIYIVLEKIKEKAELSPKGAILEYRASWEDTGLKVDEEVMILNKLSDEGVIEVVGNFGSESI